ncbi:hypothetical protein PEL8287_02363 [Roseovarius litorisediminis]|uniref:FAS1-like dehydratase domain-containing protein n=1 Tax=Roseovarius litorisediminis TaxID=1312363 RepID=A0A1Y5SV71_9RHOB|nr:MaoC family dehydratase N-terminal domain-containing protein [Roseovarius litorisediminis]SLN45789.1 hypothetical protein PEL8287_02363 [Roseovarius litorisediminis]
MSEAIQTLSDVIDPARARAMQAILGHDVAIENGMSLPPFFHQLYFWDPQPPENLGRDGHPKVGGVIPDMGLPRRMWAGGRLKFHAPLIAGQGAKRVSFVEMTERKQGRSGPLGFVTLRHEIWQEGQLCITDWQDLVYRQDPDRDVPKPNPPVARQDEKVCQVQCFDSTMLFRYSALTFNGHRIHYDIDYAKKVEGYGGLVVHGPLLAQLLILLAEKQLGSLTSFEFRATAPLLHFEQAQLCWIDGAAWVRGPDGRQCMQAHAVG